MGAAVSPGLARGMSLDAMLGVSSAGASDGKAPMTKAQSMFAAAGVSPGGGAGALSPAAAAVGSPPSTAGGVTVEVPRTPGTQRIGSSAIALLTSPGPGLSPASPFTPSIGGPIT